MFRNEVGLQVLEEGDVVKVGNGATRYEVRGNVSDGITVVTSLNTGKSTSQRRDRLSLVENVRDTDAWKEANEAKEEPVKETSAYAKAVLVALNKLQKHVYAGTVSEKTKGKRRALGRRQKASRKANR